MALPKTMSIDELRKRNEATKAARDAKPKPATPTSSG